MYGLTYPVIKYVCGRNYIMPFHKHPLDAVLTCLCENMHPQHGEKDVEKIMFRVLLNINFLRHPEFYIPNKCHSK